jgi:hypothetical protein
MFLLFICMHFWVWGILRRWSAHAPFAREVIRYCQNFEEHWSSQQLSRGQCVYSGHTSTFYSLLQRTKHQTKFNSKYLTPWSRVVHDSDSDGHEIPRLLRNSKLRYRVRPQQHFTGPSNEPYESTLQWTLISCFFQIILIFSPNYAHFFFSCVFTEILLAFLRLS